MVEEFWAKGSGVSLSEHVEDVIEAVAVLREKCGSVVPEEWWLALQYAALLHDVGKIDPVFQARIKKMSLPGRGTDIPHSIMSLFFIRPDQFPLEPRYVIAVLSAVAFHHWRDYFPDLLMGYRAEEVRRRAEEMLNNREEWVRRILKVRTFMEDIARRYDLEPGVISFNDTLTEYLSCNDLGTSGLLVPPYTLIFLPSKLKNMIGGERDDERLRVFVSGNLMRADHFASLVEESRSDITVSDIEAGNALSYEEFDRVLSRRFGRENYWQKAFFNSKPYLKGENLVLVAPTGFGKTEFSYLWGAGRKNFLVLPMRAAVNKIWERTSTLVSAAGNLGSDCVALLHGDTALELYFFEKGKGILETEGERRKAIELARHLSSPYIVGTADQVAPAALRYPGYERVFAALMNGALIIDEVQAYDPKAAAIVTHLIQQNSYFGGRTLLMTATLPPFILKELKNRIGLKEHQVVNLLDKEQDFPGIASSCRHRLSFAFHEDGFEPVRQQIVRAARNGKRVLVVMNTVQAACKIFESIKEVLSGQGDFIKVLLLHSRFTRQRRKELEEMVVEELMPNRICKTKVPCIVVATQVVEASLDINADMIFTEAAPADSLVQRMGRVYRHYARSEGNNAPGDANVVILLDRTRGRDGDLVLSSGVGGRVYDRHLTVLSLVMLLVLTRDQKVVTRKKLDFLVEDPWAKCFPRRSEKSRKKGEEKEKSLPNEEFVKLVEECLGESKTILLTEKDKMDWVEITYEALELGGRGDFPIDLGKYLDGYKRTLDVLDSGYCSDKRRDAMKLFRDIAEISGIPREMAPCFYRAIADWIAKNREKADYLKLAAEILPYYVVTCPYHFGRGNETVFQPLDIEQIISRLPDSVDGKVMRLKIDRWLSDLWVIDLPYDDEKGLMYY